MFTNVTKVFLLICEASHSHSHSPTPTHSHSHSNSHSHVFYYLVIGGDPPLQVHGKIWGCGCCCGCGCEWGWAVAVAVAVAGLTKFFFNHIQKDFLQRARF